MDSQFYLLLQVVDRPGVLAKIAGAFGENQVSIKSVWQEGTGESARLVLVTHRAREGAFRATLEALKALDVVLAVESVMRVEGEE
jgi:homoserine dehydrogenase